MMKSTLIPSHNYEATLIFFATVNIFVLSIVVVFCCKLKISLKQTSMLLFDALGA